MFQDSKITCWRAVQSVCWYCITGKTDCVRSAGRGRPPSLRQDGGVAFSWVSLYLSTERSSSPFLSHILIWILVHPPHPPPRKGGFLRRWKLGETMIVPLDLNSLSKNLSRSYAQSPCFKGELFWRWGRNWMPAWGESRRRPGKTLPAGERGSGVRHLCFN